MRGILLYACCLYTLRCILLYRVNADMVYLLLLEKKLFFVMLPPWCATLGVQRLVGSRLGIVAERRVPYKKRQQPIFLKPINTDIYGTFIEQAEL